MAKQKNAKNPVGLGGHRKNFVDLLNTFSKYGYSRWQVFTDFLQLSAISLANCDRYCLVNEQATIDEREKQYLNTIGKYKKEVQELFPQMLYEVVEEMQSYCPNHLTDVLGEMFHSMEFQDEWKGQFFTPQNVCDFIGIINFSDSDAAIKEKGFVTINEPCCGAGAMILGACNGMREAGLNPNTQALVVANDLDERCVHMCYIQLSLYGIPAIVQRQNSLTQETFGAPWFTPVFILDGWSLKLHRAFKREEKTVPIKQEPIPIQSPKEIHYEQLSLF